MVEIQSTHKHGDVDRFSEVARATPPCGQPQNGDETDTRK